MNQDPQQPHPYVLKQKIKLEGATIRHLAPFPEGWLDGAYWRAWHRTSALFDPPLAKRLETKLFTTETWKAMTAQFQNALVVAGDQKIYILWPFDAESCPVMVQLPPVLSTKSQKVPSDKINATWALNPDNPYEPLVLFTVDRLVYIFNVCTRKLEGCLRGHGGEITSIAVHPFCPHIFITTSRDYTSRIYDLTRTPQKELNNPPWPPMTVQSRAGPAFALDAPGGEGFGIGRCVVVLAGGRSAGHQGGVFAASFKSDHPVVATCGMDRAVKIWHIPYFSEEQTLIREDKPLFSTTMIHKAMILSVNWLENNILLTHSAPAKMLKAVDPDTDSQESREYDADEPATLVLWKWLSVDRFFPPGWNRGASRQQILHGFGSDYQQSASFRILSTYFFPAKESHHEVPFIHVCRTNRGPLVVFSYSGTRRVFIINVTLFERRLPPPPPTLRQYLSAGELGQISAASQTKYKQTQGWDITLHEECSLETCIMLGNGKIIMAGGSDGSLFIFAESQFSAL